MAASPPNRFRSPPPSEATVATPQARRRILIADDNEDIQEMLAQFFSAEGFEVLQAFDGQEAIRLTADACPELVLLDLRMPREDGFDVLRRVRETDLDTAIVVHTAFGSESLALEALRGGADDYLKKPVPIGVLLERVNAVLIAKQGHNLLRHRAEQRVRESEELYRATAAELAARVATIDITQEIARAVLSNLDLEQIAWTIVTRWRRLLPYDWASIAIIEPDREHWVNLAVFDERGLAIAEAGRRLSLGDSLLQRVVEKGEALYIPDLQSQSDLPKIARDVRAAGIRSLLIVPVPIHGEVAGSINLASTEPGSFTTRHQAVATELVGTAAIAIQNGRLYRDLQVSYASLERAQADLLRQERLAALGQISAVMAHEVRNPLGVIYNSLGPLRELLRPTGDAAMLLSIIEEEADRLNRIVGSLLDFARPTSLELQEGDLSSLLNDVVRDAATDSAFRDEIEIRLDCQKRPSAVQFDAHLLRQALINLLQNAFQAISGAGKVLVQCRKVQRDGRAFAQITISDDGVGMRPDVLDRIFDPFFTTRATGTGLGLPIVKRVVEDHQGLLEVESREGEGTRFVISLPCRSLGSGARGPRPGGGPVPGA